MSQQSRPQVQIMTSGRCRPNPGPGQWVAMLTAIANNESIEKVLSGSVESANNQRMELLAVVESLEHLKSACTVTLMPQSKYIVDGLTKWVENWITSNWQTSKHQPVKNADLWKRLAVQMERHQITVEWLKSDATQLARLQTLLDSSVEPTTQSSVEEPAVADPPSDYRLLIAGSRNMSENMAEYARRVVTRAIENQWVIVVGDNPQGIDAVVVAECSRLQYSAVIVVGIANTPRNGGVPDARYVKIGLSYGERDRLMAQAVDRGIYIWDGRSPGTFQGYQAMQELGKTAHLMNFAQTFA